MRVRYRDWRGFFAEVTGFSQQAPSPLLELLLAFHYYAAQSNMAAGTLKTFMQHSIDTNSH